MIDTPGWVRDAVFYQIFPDRFAASERVAKPGPLESWDAPPTIDGFKGGDLLGVAERLPYLAELGITALYLTPIFASASNHRYHTYDYLRVDPLLGGDPALRELLDAAHARGMRVILDGVFNHTGRGFWPFHHVLETGAASPYVDWFHFDRRALEAGRRPLAYPDTGRTIQASDAPGGAGALEDGRFGRSFGELGYQAWWDLPALPKLNTDNPAVREYLFGVAEHWIRFGIDGWRLDVPGEIDDPPFWRTFRDRVRAANPEAYIVGELWEESQDWLRGDRFDAVMHYPLAQAILGFAAGSHLDRETVARHHEYGRRVRTLDGPGFASELGRILGLYDPAVVDVQLNLLGSHDTPRFRTLCSGDLDAVRLAILLQATLPGAPCVYYGDEIGLEGGNDPDCRRAFPWDERRWEGGLRAFTAAAFALRHAEPALRAGPVAIVDARGDAVAFAREREGRRFVVAINAGESPMTLELPSGTVDPLPRSTVRLLSELDGWTVELVALPDGGSRLRLPGRAGAVLGPPPAAA